MVQEGNVKNWATTIIHTFHPFLLLSPLRHETDLRLEQKGEKGLEVDKWMNKQVSTLTGSRVCPQLTYEN